MVYSKFFGRVQAISNLEIHDFLDEHEIYLFYLWNEYKDYMVRRPKDRIIYDAKDYARLATLFEKNIKIILPNCDLMAINTSEYDLTETINLIKRQLWTIPQYEQ